MTIATEAVTLLATSELSVGNALRYFLAGAARLCLAFPFLLLASWLPAAVTAGLAWAIGSALRLNKMPKAASLPRAKWPQVSLGTILAVLGLGLVWLAECVFVVRGMVADGIQFAPWFALLVGTNSD